MEIAEAAIAKGDGGISAADGEEGVLSRLILRITEDYVEFGDLDPAVRG
jgi:hypothetical protein